MLPPKSLGNAIVMATPTYGWLDVDFVMNLRTHAAPIHTSLIWYSTKGDRFGEAVEVGEARDTIVRFALAENASHIFFRDHDVLAPPDSLPVLLARDTPVIGGLYYSKERPPWPLLIKDRRPSFDWQHGDVVKCDGIGMGCTLIDTEVFRQLEPPWFVTRSEGRTDDALSISMSEDISFCNRLIDELGIYPYCDTSVACIHYDINDRTQFFYDHNVGTGVWQEAGQPTGKAILPIDHPDLSVTDLTKESEPK